MTDIIYPTIDLFLYDLRYSLGDTLEEIEQNRQHFQNKLPENVRSLLIECDQVDESEYIHLLKKNSEPFQPDYNYYPFDGYYYPVLLGDSYGLLLDCALNNRTEIQPAKCFADVKAEVERRLEGERAIIGQTWMLSGWLPPFQTKSQEEVARNCYEALAPGMNWEGDLEGQGQFLGATVFELTQDKQHTVIIIYPDEATSTQSGKFYSDWMRLFYYRHKILWAYSQSRLLKKSLQTYFSKIKAGSGPLKRDRHNGSKLNTLRKSLMEVQEALNDYTRDLTTLDFQGSTIDINRVNYEKRLGRIRQKAKKLEVKAETELRFLTEFSRLVKDKYRLQITKDSENLERGLKLVSDTINVVRSRVEVEKAERDRHFQNFVSVLGAGGTFGYFIIALPGLSEKNNNPIRSYLIRSFHLKLSTQETTPKEPWWLMPTTEGVYVLSGFFIAILVLSVWRRLSERSR